MPGWRVPLPSAGSYGITNILSRHGQNALFVQAEHDENYALEHRRFASIPANRLISAEVQLDISIGLDFDFDEDSFSALLVDSAFPNCSGPIEECFETIDFGRDAQWTRNTLDASSAVTRSDWQGFMLMLLMSENHISDSSLGFVDNIDFSVCVLGDLPNHQPARTNPRPVDLDRLFEAVGDKTSVEEP